MKNYDSYDFIPFDKRFELSGFVDENGLYYTQGEGTASKSYADKKLVFHTHPEHLDTITNLPSPRDILNFIFSENKISIIKTENVIIKLERTENTITTDEILEDINFLFNVRMFMDNFLFEETLYLIVFNLTKLKITRNDWVKTWKFVVKNIFHIKLIEYKKEV